MRYVGIGGRVDVTFVEDLGIGGYLWFVLLKCSCGKDGFNNWGDVVGVECLYRLDVTVGSVMWMDMQVGKGRVVSCAKWFVISGWEDGR